MHFSRFKFAIAIVSIYFGFVISSAFSEDVSINQNPVPTLERERLRLDELLKAIGNSQFLCQIDHNPADKFVEVLLADFKKNRFLILYLADSLESLLSLEILE